MSFFYKKRTMPYLQSTRFHACKHFIQSLVVIALYKNELIKMCFVLLRVGFIITFLCVVTLLSFGNFKFMNRGFICCLINPTSIHIKSVLATFSNNVHQHLWYYIQCTRNISRIRTLISLKNHYYILTEKYISHH